MSEAKSGNKQRVRFPGFRSPGDRLLYSHFFSPSLKR
jgi:hypothetical protein